MKVMCLVQYGQNPTDSIREQISLLSVEEENYGKELEQFWEESYRLKEDMRQIIRCSHLETLTQVSVRHQAEV